MDADYVAVKAYFEAIRPSFSDNYRRALTALASIKSKKGGDSSYEKDIFCHYAELAIDEYENRENTHK